MLRETYFTGSQQMFENHEVLAVLGKRNLHIFEIFHSEPPRHLAEAGQQPRADATEKSIRGRHEQAGNQMAAIRAGRIQDGRGPDSWHIFPMDSLEFLRPFGMQCITRLAALQLGHEQIFDRRGNHLHWPILPAGRAIPPIRKACFLP
jgi:hypothetical protein